MACEADTPGQAGWLVFLLFSLMFMIEMRIDFAYVAAAVDIEYQRKHFFSHHIHRTP